MHHFRLFKCLLLCVVVSGRDVINQATFVDVSMLEISTTTTGSTTSTCSTTVIKTSSDTLSDSEESSDSADPTAPSSMFSTSMAPPSPTPVDQDEDLISAFVPLIDEMGENINFVQSVPNRDIVITEPQIPTDSTGTTVSSEDPDDHSGTDVSTIQPDVPVTDGSFSTETILAERRTKETILGSGITTAMASDITKTHTEPTDPTLKEVLSSSESAESTVTISAHSMTPYTTYTTPGTSAEAGASSTTVHVIDKSHSQLPEYSGDTAEDVQGSFTSAPMASTAASTLPSQVAEVTETQPSQMSTVMQMQNTAGKTYIYFFFT